MLKPILFAAFSCFFVQNISAQSGLKMFDNSYVHEIRVYFDEPDFWQILGNNYNLDNDSDPNTIGGSLEAEVIIDGNTVSQVGVRQKGFFSNWGSGSALKKPLKLDFNEFLEDGKYDKLKSINLQNAFKDPTFMRDMLSYQILRDFGVAAPRSSYAKVYLNDELWGLYVVVESVNKTFLKEHFGDNEGNLYKAGFTSMQYSGLDQSNYYSEFELKTNETENDWSRLVHLLKVIKNTPAALFRDSLSKYMDMESYFKTMAVDVTILNWDSHFDHGRNFYLYDNPADGKFHWIPWDYNLAFANNFDQYDLTISNLRSQFDYDKILPKRVLGNTAFKQEYLQYACQLHKEVFTPQHLNPIIDQAKALIVNDVQADPNKFYDDMEIFHESINDGIVTTVIDSFHFVDSVWNGSMWEVTDTIFIFEYTEEFIGLKSLIANRHEVLQSELENQWQITCLSDTDTPLAAGFEAWPNPVADWLHLRLPEPGARISLYDAQGRLLKSAQFDQDAFSLSMSEHRPGVYWVECVTQQGKSTAKVLVAR